MVDNVCASNLLPYHCVARAYYYVVHADHDCVAHTYYYCAARAYHDCVVPAYGYCVARAYSLSHTSHATCPPLRAHASPLLHRRTRF